MDQKFVKENEKTLTWNEMVYEFTTEVTGGELTDERIANMDDEEFVAAVKKYTGYELEEK